MKSKIIGQLKQDENISDWWKSAAVEVPFFDNQKLSIQFIDFVPEEDTAFLVEADLALSNFLSLNAEDRKSISELVHKNCMDFLDAVEFDEADNLLRAITDKNAIWNFIQPTEIYVSRRHRRDNDIYVQVACNCDWEQEHGLQLVFRQGKQLTRISNQDGHLTEADAYDRPDNEDELLSRFEYAKTPLTIPNEDKPMNQNPLSEVADEELLQKAKKKKSVDITNAVLIGFMMGVVVYSIAKNSLGFFTLIPLFIAYKLYNNSKKEKDLEEVLKKRNLK